MNKLTDRQKQAINTKLKITKVATELFKTKGFDSVKVQDICEVANISVGAFYHHFKSKIEIINISYEQIDILLMDRLNSKEFHSYLDKLIFLLEDGAHMMEELGFVFVGEIYRNLISTKGKYSTHPERHITLLVREILEDALKNGELNSFTSLNDLTITIMRISRGDIFDWCLHEGSYNLKSKMVYDLNLILSNFKS